MNAVKTTSHFRKYFSDNEIEFDVRDTDYKVVWSLDNNAESGENVEDILEEN